MMANLSFHVLPLKTTHETHETMFRTWATYALAGVWSMQKSAIIYLFAWKRLSERGALSTTFSVSFLARNLINLQFLKLFSARTGNSQGSEQDQDQKKPPNKATGLPWTVIRMDLWCMNTTRDLARPFGIS